MCCGNRVVENRKVRASSTTFEVVDASGGVVETKTSEIAAKLAAARLGGTVRRVTSSS